MIRYQSSLDTSEFQNYAGPRFWIAARESELAEQIMTHELRMRREQQDSPNSKKFFAVDVEFLVILVELILKVVRWIVRDFQSRKCILENSQTPWNFKAGKSTSRLKYVQRQANPQITMHWITEVEKAQSIDELMTSQSILWRKDFPAYEMLDVLIVSSLKKSFSTRIFTS